MMRSCTWILIGLMFWTIGCRRQDTANGGPAPADSAQQPPDVSLGTPTDEPGSPATAPTEPDAPAPAEPDVPPPAEPPPVEPDAPATAGADVATLIGRLADDSTRDRAAAELKAKGAAVVPQLIESLAHESWQARAGAAFALGMFGQDAAAALPALRELSTDDQQEAVRDAAAFAIDAIGTP